MNQLLSNIRWMCDDARMLSCESAAYGTAQHAESLSYGRQREYRLENGMPVYDPIPLPEEPLYDLASLTKLFTCVVILRMAELGTISLSEKIGEVDPRFGHLRETSLEDVLCYRAALRTDGRIDEAPCREEGLRRLFATSSCEPPRIRLYSDINSMIVKYVIEARSGLPFFEAVRKYILEPAGMNDTWSRVPESELPRCIDYSLEYQILGGRYILRTDIRPGVPNDPKAALLDCGGTDLCGHAGLFSSQSDMIRFCQALIGGKLISPETLASIGVNRTGFPYGDGTYRQYLGLLSFAHHPLQRLSEVPTWMSENAFALSGFTGNHIAFDPQRGCFLVYLGNRCHARLSKLVPPEGKTLADYGLGSRGEGCVTWTDGKQIPSSCKYVFYKDELLHNPVRERMEELGWI